jgi:hypothetical protein
MGNRQAINEAIFSAIDTLHAENEDTHLDKSLDTVLFGEGSTLDSMKLVSLILNTEAEIGDRLGVTITLADEKAFSYKNSPFHTIDSLGAYIETLLAEAGHG